MGRRGGKLYKQTPPSNLCYYGGKEDFATERHPEHTKRAQS